MVQSKQHMGRDEKQMIQLYVQQIKHVVREDHDLTRNRIAIKKGRREYYKLQRSKLTYRQQTRVHYLCKKRKHNMLVTFNDLKNR